MSSWAICVFSAQCSDSSWRSTLHEDDRWFCYEKLANRGQPQKYHIKMPNKTWQYSIYLHNMLLSRISRTMKCLAPVPSWIFPPGLQQKAAAWIVWLRHGIPQAPAKVNVCKLAWYCHPTFNSQLLNSPKTCCLLMPSDARFRVRVGWNAS